MAVGVAKTNKSKCGQGQKKSFLYTALSTAIICSAQQAWANTADDHQAKLIGKPKALLDEETAQSAQVIADVLLYTPAQIEARLHNATQENPLILDSADASLVSRLDDKRPPVGLDIDAVAQLPTPDDIQGKNITKNAQESPDLTNRIPKYKKSSHRDLIEPVIQEEQIKKPNAIKRLYNKLFNDGVDAVVRLETEFYHADGTTPISKSQGIDLDIEADGKIVKMSRSELTKEPIANIKAMLEDMAAESVSDFNSALPRLRQAVDTAARAVGYYEVDFQIVKVDAGKVGIIINDIGEPVRISNQALEVRGDGKHNTAYQKAVKEAKLTQDDVFHHGNYEAVKSAIVDASAEQGYFDGRWLNNSADVILPDNVADVSLVYDSGEQYSFDDVVFFTVDEKTGQLTTDPNKLPVKSELLKKLVTFEMGDAYNRVAVRDLSSNLLATGYFNAVNTETVLPDNKAGTQDIAFENDDGMADDTKQVVDLGDGVVAEVAPIEFSASQVIQDKLALVTQKAERLYNMPEDRLLITDSRKKSRSVLGRISDAVSSVAKMILPDESKDEFDAAKDIQIPTLVGRKTPQEVYADKKVPLYVFVMTDKPRDAQIGLGWGSDSGARLITKFEHHLINKSGYQANADIRLSKDKKGVGLSITKPMSHPINDKLRASLSYDDEVIGGAKGTFNLSSRTLQQSLSRNIINQSGWNKSFSLRYRLDRLKTGEPTKSWKDLPVHFLDGKPIQKALLAGFAISKTVTDNPVNPMRGYRQSYSLEAGAKSLLTDTNMAIARMGLGGVYSFGDNAYGKNRAHQVIGSLNLGYLWADNFNAVPYKLRFFAGGDQSIRGYNYETLSPISNKGYLTGGQALAVVSGEYNYEVMNGLRVAAFADVGNAYNKDFSNETKIGAGLGIRYASPVGQVRVDVATGVKEDKHSVKLHFFIGTPF